uniref:Uncharacterized protein n=1 Tax=Setaria italica TaxID=4555 RepID=K3ZYB0_SETIT
MHSRDSLSSHECIKVSVTNYRRLQNLINWSANIFHKGHGTKSLSKPSPFNQSIKRTETSSASVAETSPTRLLLLKKGQEQQQIHLSNCTMHECECKEKLFVFHSKH